MVDRLFVYPTIPSDQDLRLDGSIGPIQSDSGGLPEKHPLLRFIDPNAIRNPHTRWAIL
jgi:hypothetical protein